MGNSCSIDELTCFDSSSRIDVFDFSFARESQRKEYLLSEVPENFREALAKFNPGLLYLKFVLTMRVRFTEPFKSIYALVSRIAPFDALELEQRIENTSVEDLKALGRFETLGPFAFSSETIHLDFFIPKGLIHRSTNVYVFDQDFKLLIKGRMTFVVDEEFHVNLVMRNNQENERAKRLQLIANQKLANLSGASKDMYELADLASKLKLPSLRFIESTDGVKLAFKVFPPIGQSENPKAYLVIVTENGFIVDVTADIIARRFPITVVLFEIRGFGHSGGDRGTTPSKQQSLLDLRLIVRHIKLNNLPLPIVLGGSLMSGFLLNYASWKEREPFDGLILLAPFLGLSSRRTWNATGFQRLNQLTQVKRDFGAVLYSELGSGLAKSPQDFEIQLDLSEDIYEKNPLFVNRLSAMLMSAMDASDIEAECGALTVPLGVWISEDDELFLPQEVMATFSKAKNAELKIVPKAGPHFKFLLWCPNYIAPWILQLPSVVSQSPAGLMPMSRRRVSWDSSALDALRAQSTSDESIFEYLAALEAHSLLAQPKSFLEAYSEQAILTFQRFDADVDSCVGTVVYMQSLCPIAINPTSYQKQGINVFLLNLQGVCEIGAASRTVYEYLGFFIRYVRMNYPRAPIFLGGLGFMGNVVINYLTNQPREPVNGCVLLAPLCHSGDISGLSAGSALALAGSEYAVLGTTRPEGSTLPGSDFGECKATDLLEKLRVNDVPDAFQRLDVPYTLWMAENDSLVPAGSLMTDGVGPLVAMRSHCEAGIVRGSSHHNLPLRAEANIVGWIVSHHAAFSCTIEPVFENPVLADFDRFELIGRGGSGKVSVAQQRQNGRFMAIKVLSKRRLIDRGEVDRVKTERTILRTLTNHPFIVKYYGSMHDEKNVYLVMDFIVGGELLTHLKMCERFDDGKAKFYAAELVLALEYVHSCGIVYRDLKPENVLLDAMGHIKLIDFGVARFCDVQGDERCYTMCGTPEYLSPEMIAKDGYGRSCDLWALGVVIFEMLVGSLPFTARTEKLVYRKILYSKPELPSFLSETVCDLIRGLLEQVPEKRLGCGSKGWEEVKRHPWFAEVDWGALAARTLPSPYVPTFGSEGDTTNYVVDDQAVSSASEGELNDDEVYEIFKDF